MTAVAKSTFGWRKLAEVEAGDRELKNRRSLARDEHRVTVHAHNSGYDMVVWHNERGYVVVVDIPAHQLVVTGTGTTLAEAKRRVVEHAARDHNVVLRGLLPRSS